MELAAPSPVAIPAAMPLAQAARDTVDAADRRISPRRRVLKNALIVFQSGYCTLRCHILNLSDTGAQLMPADVTQCPSEFVLKPQIGRERDCEVVWRKGGVVGVRYI
jgi:hypothetical protein